MRRIIVFIVFFVLFLTFIVLNLDYRSDVSIGFAKFENIPIFLTVFFAFVFGMFFTIPLFLIKGRKNTINEDVSSAKKPKKNKKVKSKNNSGSIHYIGDEQNTQINKEKGSYGID